MEVHGVLGNGFQEKVYHIALGREFELQQLNFTQEVDMNIFYKDAHCGTRRVDFLIQGIILVEIKAVIELEDRHLNQAMNYLEAYNLEIGLLINFGATSLQFKRVHNNKFKHS